MVRSQTSWPIKWGYATQAFSRHAPTDILCRSLAPLDGRPEQDDVLIAEVVALHQHSRIELPNGRNSKLFEGDVVGVAYGHRYATRQYHGLIPPNYEICHLLSVAGVCGQVIGTTSVMDEPTLLRPIGHPVDETGRRINLRQFGMRPTMGSKRMPTTVLVVGSSMDAGKTTAAASVVQGLRHSGARVGAAKLTGTGSAKDLMLMIDSGAYAALDFTAVGHASTAACSRQDLVNIVEVVQTNLADAGVDYIVMEIADGIIQRETEMLLRYFQSEQCIDYVIYCCCDTLGVQAGVERLRDLQLNVTLISGLAACSELSADEARAETDIPVYQAAQLAEAEISLQLFPRRSSTQSKTIRTAELVTIAG